MKRIAEGKKYNDRNGSGGGDLRLVSDKIGELGTFGRRFIMDGAFRTGVMEGTLDYVASLIHNVISGKPAPFITYHHGSFMVHNSYFVDHGFWIGYEMGNTKPGVGGFVHYGAGHIGVGESQGVIKHEAGHMRQFQVDGMGDFAPFIEVSNELHQGTMGYGVTYYPMYMILGLDKFKSLAAYNVALFEGDGFGMQILDGILMKSDYEISGIYGNMSNFWWNILYAYIALR